MSFFKIKNLSSGKDIIKRVELYSEKKIGILKEAYPEYTLKKKKKKRLQIDKKNTGGEKKTGDSKEVDCFNTKNLISVEEMSYSLIRG